MSSTSPPKGLELIVTREMRNPQWPLLTDWIEGSAAQDKVQIRAVFDTGKSLFEELRNLEGLKGEAAFRSWVDRVKEHEASLLAKSVSATNA